MRENRQAEKMQQIRPAILVTRPLSDAGGFAGRLRELGWEPVLAPLSEIVTEKPLPPLTETPQAILLTSANAASGLENIDRDVPVYTVGDATAEKVLSLGFLTIQSAKGTALDLAALVERSLKREGGALLWPSGAEVRVDLQEKLSKAGYTVDRYIVYRTELAQSLPVATIQRLRDQRIHAATFFSPRSAHHFARLIRESKVDVAVRSLVAYCMSAAIAEAAKELRWKRVESAATPDMESLLALIGPASENDAPEMEIT